MLDMIQKVRAHCAYIYVICFAFAGPVFGGAYAAHAEGVLFTAPEIAVSSLPGERVDYFLYVPKSIGNSPEILVAVHGISRNAEDYVELLAPYAEKYGVILVAPFSQGKYSRTIRGLVGQGGAGVPTIHCRPSSMM